MGWFQKKKKQALFGEHIVPSCAYCQNNSGIAGEVICARGQTPQGEPACCKKHYQYDPLRRDPKPAPSLQTSRFRPEDFQL